MLPLYFVSLLTALCLCIFRKGKVEESLRNAEGMYVNCFGSYTGFLGHLSSMRLCIHSLPRHGAEADPGE